MIKTITKTYGKGWYTSTYSFEVSDFKDGEQPLHTGYKRKYRKTKWSKHDYWTERYEDASFCWKDQSKRQRQYYRVVAI